MPLGMRQSTRMLNDKDTAELLRYAFRHSLVSVDAVRAWGDSLIERCDVAPEWMIDIALAKTRDADAFLGRVPDCDGVPKFVPLLCALLCRRWENDAIPIGTVRSLGWELHLADLLTETVDGFANWGVTLEVEAESLDEGWVTESDIRDLINSLLQPYQPLSGDLPEWVNE